MSAWASVVKAELIINDQYADGGNDGIRGYDARA